MQSLGALLFVLALIGVVFWALRRTGVGTFGRTKAPISIEGAVPLGERRSLVVVSIEGRRLLLGLTPVQVSLVTELGRSNAYLPGPLSEGASESGERP
jgi:flagellar biosynthetic protein FliO